MHKISEGELVEKLKFVAKGEPKGKPTFGMPIPEAMMSREIKEPNDYLNYLAKYLNAQSGAPTLGRGQVVDNLLQDPDQDVDLAKEVDKAYDAQLKLKLKAQKQRSPVAQSLLDLKRGHKESKKEHILEEIRKAPTEGSGTAPDSPYHSDSSDNSIWDSNGNDKTKSDKDSDHGDDNDDSDKDFDVGEDQTTGFSILEYYSRFLNEPSKVEMSDLLNEPVYTETQTLIAVPLLESIPEVQEQALVDQVIDSPPAATITITPPTKLKKKQAKKLLKKAI
ncbi:hypothetical protein Tco_1177745 [Tanacetum coccineum]